MSELLEFIATLGSSSGDSLFDRHPAARLILAVVLLAVAYSVYVIWWRA